MATDQEREDDGDGTAAYASPPCFMHEFQSEYFREMSGAELLRLLNELLEGERAGAQALPN